MVRFHEVSFTPSPGLAETRGLDIARRLRAMIERLVILRGHPSLAMSLPDWLRSYNGYFSGDFAQGDPFAISMDGGGTAAVTFLLTEPHPEAKPSIWGRAGEHLVLAAAFFRAPGAFPSIESIQGGTDVSFRYVHDRRKYLRGPGRQCYAVRFIKIHSVGTVQYVNDRGLFTGRADVIPVDPSSAPWASLTATPEQIAEFLAFPTEPRSQSLVCCRCGEEMESASVETSHRVYGRSLRVRVDAPYCACGEVYLTEDQLRFIYLEELRSPFHTKTLGLTVYTRLTRVSELLRASAEEAAKLRSFIKEGRPPFRWWNRVSYLASQQLDVNTVVEFL